MFIAKILIQRKLSDEIDMVKLPNFNMKDTLSVLKKDIDLFEIEGLYNEEKVNYLSKQPSSISNNVELATQFLIAGYPDSTLKILDEIYVSNNFIKNTFLKLRFGLKPKLKSTLFSSYIFDQNWGNESFQRGLCYLRLAEQKNCQSNHSASSCIMPFDEGAIHKKSSYSATAIKYLSAHLDKYPNDIVALWLLNIAYMTKGDYPKNVPKERYVDFNKFNDENITINKFINTAQTKNVDHVSLYGGVIMEDFNNDGHLDLFSTSGDLKTNVKLFFNDGNGSFTNHTLKSGLKGITGGVNAIQADHNNDGLTDIYIIRGCSLNKEGSKHPNSLLRNNGDGSFTDVTNDAGLLTFWSSHTACWADINNNGHLDLFVGNERANSQLFINNGNGTFSEASKEANIVLNEYVKGALWFDYDNDGLQDLYVSTYAGKNHLYKNLGTDLNKTIPKFKETTKESGVSEPFYSFPVATLDFNNDGFQDLLVADFTLSIKEFIRPYFTGQPEKIHPAL